MDIDLLTFENILKRIDNNETLNEQDKYHEYQKSSQIQNKNDSNDQNIRNYDSKQVENLYRETDKRTIVINNLPLDLDRQELYDILKDNGAKNIEEIRFLKNQKTKEFSGRAFVQFYKEKHAEAMLTMNNFKIKDNQIYVILASEKRKKDEYRQKTKQNTNHIYNRQQNKGILIRNLAGTLRRLKEDDIKNLFYPFGDIYFVDIKYDTNKEENDGYAVVIFYESKDASIAIQKMNGYLVNGIPLIITTLPEDINLFYNNLKYKGYKDLETNQEIKYIHKKLKGLCNDKVNDEKEVEENNFIFLKKQLENHKHFSNKPKKILGIFNLWGSLTDKISDQKQFLNDLRIDVVQKCEQYGTVRESYIDFQFKGVIVKMGSKQTTQKMLKDFQQELFDKRIIICAYLSKRYLKNLKQLFYLINQFNKLNDK